MRGGYAKGLKKIEEKKVILKKTIFILKNGYFFKILKL